MEELEQGLSALLKSMTEMTPEILGGLTPQERNKIYRMLRLEVARFEQGYEVNGASCNSGLRCPRESQSAKRLGLRFRALLIEGDAERFALVT